MRLTKFALAALLTAAVATPASTQTTNEHRHHEGQVPPGDPAQVPRPAQDVARDASRKPEAMLRFAEVRPGQKVAELLPGGGYFTRIFAGAVGAEGTVYAVVSSARPQGLEGLKPVTDAYPNVRASVQPLARLKVPEPVDLVWTSQNYHDFPRADVAAINRAAFDALKPGGIYVVVDHSGAPGSGDSQVSTLHRIAKETVVADVTAAGFRLDGEDLSLANPADDRARNVTDPAIRGRTDQFVLRFRKPA